MKLQSRMMKEIDYRPFSQTLLVMFNDGKIWEYQNVRVEIWQVLQSVLTANRLLGKVGSDESVSFGRLFHYLIKIHGSRYPAKHLPELTTCDLIPLEE